MRKKWLRGGETGAGNGLFKACSIEVMFSSNCLKYGSGHIESSERVGVQKELSKRRAMNLENRSRQDREML